MSKRIGIVGGGQLAAFLVQEARSRDTEITAIDPEPNCPAALKGAAIIEAGLQDADALDQLAPDVDVITVDLEAVNVEALTRLERNGKTIVPTTDILRTLTNKLTQKTAMAEHGIPTSEFIPFDGKDPSDAGKLGWPAVNKAATGGYDGRGVAIINDESELGNLLPVPGFFERYVEHQVEIAVMVARGSGTTVTYEPVEMVFNQEGNLLDELVAPARISEALREQAKALAARTIEAIAGDGIYGVEMFLTPDNRLLVNEISPRTHNSGHYTMDACSVSQFQQQYRILNGLEPEDFEQTHAAVMFNLLGEPGYQGDTVVEGFDECSAEEGVHAYIYGKQRCFPLRKMAHVTVVAGSVEEALKIAQAVRPTIRIRGANTIEQ